MVIYCSEAYHGAKAEDETPKSLYDSAYGYGCQIKSEEI